VDVSGSYVFLPAIGYGNDYPTGWLAAVGVAVTSVIGVVGEVGGSYKTVDSFLGEPALRASTYNFMVGPKIVSHRNRLFTPFVQVQFGRIRIGNNYGGYDSGFRGSLAAASTSTPRALSAFDFKGISDFQAPT
jgi:hypothetical protein